MNAPNRFDRHPISATLTVALALVVIALLGAEILLRIIGLGDPVVYDTHPDYGYRPRPNQLVRRFGGAVVRINNLGIRANEDWDTTKSKVLFVGDSVTYGGSYVSTPDLFAVRGVPQHWSGGSAGVNGWGIENMRGLIVRHGFLPAEVYVTVLIDVDFHRGFSERPVFFRTSKPLLAIIEMIPHVVYSAEAYLHRDRPPSSPQALVAAQSVKRDVVQRAVKQLTELDDSLRAHGFVHLIYLSPSRANLERGAPPDSLVANALRLSPIRVRRLQDYPELARLDAKEIVSLYHDAAHLSRRGHAVWADVIRRDLEAALATGPPANVRR